MEKDHIASGSTLYLSTVSSAFSMLHESLQQVLSERLDWTELREVQERTYAAVTAGNDTLVLAPTAGGKSEAALIPVMTTSSNMAWEGWPACTSPRSRP